MVEEASGSGQMEQVTLHPRVTVSAGSDREVAARLHEDAHKNCFIARSVNFPVHCEPIILGAEEDAVASA